MAEYISACCAVFQGVDLIIKYIGYSSKFNKKLDNLTNTLKDLQTRRDDVLDQVVAEEFNGRQRLGEVERWLSKVQITETNTNLLVAEVNTVRQRRSMSCGRCSNISSTYRCGKKIHKMLGKVNNLLSTRFETVTMPANPRKVIYQPVPQTIGFVTKLDSTWRRLRDDRVRMLGLYGMAGVGKTTLLTLIESKLLALENDYDVVIWVEVPKDVDIGKIQNEIGKRLGLYDENWCQKPQRERASDIHTVLKSTKPRFVLLLDDLWEEVKLSTIGIPVLERSYKVVFTTRSKDVCRRMRANELIEVERLAAKDALSLLKKNAGIDILDGQMIEHAKDIVDKCLGLPLALEVIGKCLLSKTTAGEWLSVLSTLESSPTDLEGIDKKLFPILKLSYDNLKEDVKLCLKYCALFPEAYKIRRDDLVEYWIGEGILNEEHGRQKAKERGGNIIDILVEAWFLMEDGESTESKQKVYMRGLIREMALWIVFEDKEKFVVSTDAELRSLPNVNNWRIVTKISLMNNEIKSITDPPSPNPDRLVTLFLQNNKLVDIGCRFFQVLSTIVVLDLSCNLGITELPEEISLLVSLRYLNLLETRIKSLPKEFKKLIRLIHLDLESTSNLQDISPISELISLQVLRFYRSASLYGLLLESLERMLDLKLLSITIEEDFKVLEDFLGSNSARRTEGLYLEGLEVSGVSGKSFAATFGELGSLTKLGMTECSIMESESEWRDNKRNQHSPSTSSNQFTASSPWFQNLSSVVLLSCKHLTDLTWLMYAANLESLSVKISPLMEEVISKEKAGDVEAEPFRQLQVLELEYLDELKSIYWSPLSFQKLQKVQITSCPELRKLPLSDERIDVLRIELDDEWWLRGVKWERGAKERSVPVISTASVSEIHSV